MTGDDLDAMLSRRQNARLFAHRAVFARNGQRMSCGAPEVASHSPSAVQLIEVTREA